MGDVYHIYWREQGLKKRILYGRYLSYLLERTGVEIKDFLWEVFIISAGENRG